MTDLDSTPDPQVPEPAPTRLAWGIPALVPDGALVAWGARAIYRLTDVSTPTRRDYRGRVTARATSRTVAEIDIPYDRQDRIGGYDRGFGAWLNKTALPALRKWCVKSYVTTDSADVFTLTDGSYTLTASPRASFGYLYLTAWVMP
jgi:hypothetical protein